MLFAMMAKMTEINTTKKNNHDTIPNEQLQKHKWQPFIHQINDGKITLKHVPAVLDQYVRITRKPILATVP